jgi:hypothetical protein
MPEWKRYFVGDVKAPSIHTIARIAIAIWIQPTTRDFKDVLANRLRR